MKNSNLAGRAGRWSAAHWKTASDRNWYLPSWLAWLPSLSPEGEPEETPPAVLAP